GTAPNLEPANTPGKRTTPLPASPCNASLPARWHASCFPVYPVWEARTARGSSPRSQRAISPQEVPYALGRPQGPVEEVGWQVPGEVGQGDRRRLDFRRRQEGRPRGQTAGALRVQEGGGGKRSGQLPPHALKGRDYHNEAAGWHPPPGGLFFCAAPRGDNGN